MLAAFLSRWYKFCYRLERFSRIFAVSRKELVLDIGSGDSPFAPADVICEKFPWDDSERTAGFRHDRPLVVGDIEALPFRDKSFDFIHCSHVLEHTYHPDLAIKELMRVGKRGYVEMPSAYHEKVFKSFPGHLWFVRHEKGIVIFTPKPRGVLDAEINEINENELLDKDPLYNIFYYGRMHDRHTINFFWNGEIHYRVEGQSVALDDRSQDAFEKAVPEMQLDRRKPLRGLTLPGLFKKGIRWWYSGGKHLNLQELLACPSCRGPVQVVQESYRCQRCQVLYPQRSGIPILLKESANV